MAWHGAAKPSTGRRVSGARHLGSVRHLRRLAAGHRAGHQTLCARDYFQAIATIATATVGAMLGSRAGMPAWWMVGDALACWILCGVMLWLQTRVTPLEPGTR